MAERITPRSEDFGRWYTDLVIQGQLADYSPVKGCMVIRPNGYAIWERMQQVLDNMFKETGHVNAYFPLFIPESFMKKEAEHVEGFAPECAIVTHGGGEKLEEPLYVRPTSETIIWSMYKKWIMSYRDLPILINQWANVVRWEMRTRLFLRTTEFLWQEGHTAHSTFEEAEEETLKILEIYRKFAEEYMAMPVIVGRKSEAEKFAGAKHTYSIEALMQDGKALQAGTSHNLGQNFARAFDVTFQDKDGSVKHVYATSWGVSTRLIGALLLTHGDDSGVVIPPRLAQTQIVVIPIWQEATRQPVFDFTNRVFRQLQDHFSVKLDDRDQYKPGYKFTEWEMVGVPLRIEIGPRDVENNQVMVVRRDNRSKTPVGIDELVTRIEQILTVMQQEMYQRALDFQKANTHRSDNYQEFKRILEEKGGFIEAHWCGSAECEEKIKDETKATIRTIPFQREIEAGNCLICGKDSDDGRVIFAKAY
ncbi:MAG: proline--tRNA ligase [Calditrichaeota bacterium]|nr:proline--tRNA ligase [Calditrichota bacterium]RQW08169.1 MAG: proline--tRNA ligase [Calditrichota bacterium]